VRDRTIEVLTFLKLQEYSTQVLGDHTAQHRGVKNPLGNHTVKWHTALQPFGRCQLPGFDATAAFENSMSNFDVIVTSHKTIDLVFHTQGYKLKRDMTHPQGASASSVAFMHHDGMEVNEEIPAHSPTADCGRPPPVGAPPHGAHDHSGTPGGQ
jgi:hypothetical protein